MKGLPCLLFLFFATGMGQETYMDKAAFFLYSNKDSAYHYLALAEQDALLSRDTGSLLEIYTYYNAVSVQNRELQTLQKTLAKQSAIFEHLKSGLAAISDGLYYQVYYWFDMGRYHYILNDYEKATPFFYRILNTVENHPEPSVSGEFSYFLTASNNYLATVFRNQMKYEVAAEFYGENLRLHQEHGHEEEDVFDTKNLIASLKSAQGDFRSSNALAREAISYYLKTDPYYYDTSLLSTATLLINNYLKTQQADSAQVYLYQVLPYARKSERFATDFLYLQAKLEVVRKQYPAAMALYEQALQTLSKENRNGDEQARILKELGDVCTLQKDHSRAAGYYEQALSLFRSDRDQSPTKIRAKAYHLIQIFPVLNAYNQLLLRSDSKNGYSQALNNGMQALHYLDRLRKTDYTDADKLDLVANVLPILESSIEACFQLEQRTKSMEYRDTAFRFFEESKSPVLLDALSHNNATRFAGIPDSLLRQERMLKTDIASLEKEVELGRGNPGSDLFKQKRAYEKFIKTLESDYPEYYALKYKPSGVSLDQLQLSMPPGTLALSYFSGANAIYVMAISEEAEEFRKIPVEDKDLQNIASYHRMLGDPASNLADLNATSFRVYQKMLAPFMQDRELNSLLIFPDGLLRTIPFEAMNTSGNEVRFLVEKMACSYASSATLWQQLQGNPAKDPKLAAFAPKFDRSVSEGNYDLSPLPSNVAEVQHIASYFPAEIYLDREASLRNFIKTSGEHSMIHLATHAITDDDTPEYSFLAFTPDTTDTNLLYVNDVYTLDLKADLVTLSACETGVGTLRQGEGTISLARAFFYSGAKSLVYTLWNINDSASNQIMQSFYGHMARGSSKEKALQEAKVDFLKKHRETALVHPYYWSGLVVQGNTLPLVRRSYSPWYLFAFALLLPVLWYYLKILLKLLKQVFRFLFSKGTLLD